jgi:hypothetical protein
LVDASAPTEPVRTQPEHLHPRGRHVVHEAPLGRGHPLVEVHLQPHSAKVDVEGQEEVVLAQRRRGMQKLVLSPRWCRGRLDGGQKRM